MRERTKLGLGILEAALPLGVLGDALLRAPPWGVNVLLWVGALLAATAALVRQKRARLGVEGRWLVPCALAFAAAFAWRDSETLQTLDALALLLLFSLVLLRAHRGRLLRAGLTEYALACLTAGVSAALGPLLLLFEDIGWGEIPREGWKRHVAAVIRGVAIAVPLVIVFGGLFVAADAVYEGLVRRAFDFDLNVVVSHYFVFLFLAWVSAGYLRGAFLGKEPAAPGVDFPARIALGFAGTRQTGAGGESAATSDMTSAKSDTATINESGAVKGGAAATETAVRIEGAAEATSESATSTKSESAGAKSEVAGVKNESVSGARSESAGGDGVYVRGPNETGAVGGQMISLGIVEIGVVLGVLNALFFSFVAVQLRYFFGGARVVLASAGLTYAEYARRGFFELVWVAALVLPLLLAAHWLLRKENPAHERAFRWLAAGLLLMLFVVMASAFGRMRLYQSEYGQTELRLYTTAFMGWLFVVFVWFALMVLRGSRERFACGALVAALIVLGALHFVNPDERIARTNAALIRRGHALDACYLSRLSADAAPALVEVLPELQAEERGLLASALLRRWPMGDADWRTWNWSRARARDAVAGRDEMLREMSRTQAATNCRSDDLEY